MIKPISRVLMGLSLLVSASAFADQPASFSVSEGQPATALPGDRLPPSGAHMPPPPVLAPGSKPPPEPGTDAPGPTLSEALAVAQAAIESCVREGYRVSASVLDSSGQPRVTLSADGASGGHAYTGIRKALAALAFGAPTSQVKAMLERDPSLRDRTTPNMALMDGAVPLIRAGKPIGAIGVSGASGAQDELCAAAGARRLPGSG